MYKIVSAIAHFFALLGGLVLSGLVVLTCLSIIGRLINSALHSELVQNVIPTLADNLIKSGIGPINGDFELVEAGMAFAIFAFLPLCQLSGSHASVDILTNYLPPPVYNLIRLFIESVFAIVLVLIALQLFAGMQSKRASGQTSFLLEYPVWWGYVVSVPGAWVAALVSLYIAICRLIELLSGQSVLAPETDVRH